MEWGQGSCISLKSQPAAAEQGAKLATQRWPANMLQGGGMQPHYEKQPENPFFHSGGSESAERALPNPDNQADPLVKCVNSSGS